MNGGMAAVNATMVSLTGRIARSSTEVCTGIHSLPKLLCGIRSSPCAEFYTRASQVRLFHRRLAAVSPWDCYCRSNSSMNLGAIDPWRCRATLEISLWSDIVVCLSGGQNHASLTSHTPL
jgi:hypothetical protein